MSGSKASRLVHSYAMTFFLCLLTTMAPALTEAGFIHDLARNKSYRQIITHMEFMSANGIGSLLESCDKNGDSLLSILQKDKDGIQCINEILDLKKKSAIALAKSKDTMQDEGVIIRKRKNRFDEKSSSPALHGSALSGSLAPEIRLQAETEKKRSNSANECILDSIPEFKSPIIPQLACDLDRILGSFDLTSPTRSLSPAVVARVQPAKNAFSTHMEINTGPVVRRYPPRGVQDSPKKKRKRKISLNGDENDESDKENNRRHNNLFLDNEILWNLRDEKSIKNIRQQGATKSCGPTSVLMRLLDLGLKLDTATQNKLLTDSQLTTVFGLTKLIHYMDVPVSTSTEEISAEITESELQNYLQTNLAAKGPGIISITDHGGIEGHFIIVDEIRELPNHGRAVFIRDPYHGWAVPVTWKAFASRVLGELQRVLWMKRVPGASSPTKSDLTPPSSPKSPKTPENPRTLKKPRNNSPSTPEAFKTPKK